MMSEAVQCDTNPMVQQTKMMVIYPVCIPTNGATMDPPPNIPLTNPKTVTTDPT